MSLTYVAPKSLVIFPYRSLLGLLLLLGLAATPLFAQEPGQLGNIEYFTETNNQYAFVTADGAVVKVAFYRADIFRIWMGPEMELSDPASQEDTPIVVYDGKPIEVRHSEERDYHLIASETCVLRIYTNQSTT